ncbi:MAG: NAD(P)-dependent oxidoreductase [Brevinema sp.]
MKIAIYSVRPDEEGAFQTYAQKLGHTITLIPQAMSLDNLDKAEGSNGIIASDTPCSAEMIQKISSMNIKYVSTRTAGFGFYNLEALKEYGVKFARVPSYSPNSVAEFEVLSTLALIRNYKLMRNRTKNNNFGLKNLPQGLEIRNLTLGFVGMGNIGKTTAECFRGFHPARMLGFDLYPDKNLNDIEWVDLNTLLAESDVVLLNTPLTPENHYLIGSKTIPLMKTGAFLVNAARGALVDTSAVLDALDSGKLSAYAADVYENEAPIVYKDLSKEKIDDALFLRFNEHPKVTYTPHAAFYTDEAVANMIETSLSNMSEFEAQNKCKNEVALA